MLDFRYRALKVKFLQNLPLKISDFFYIHVFASFYAKSLSHLTSFNFVQVTQNL